MATSVITFQTITSHSMYVYSRVARIELGAKVFKSHHGLRNMGRVFVVHQVKSCKALTALAL